MTDIEARIKKVQTFVYEVCPLIDYYCNGESIPDRKEIIEDTEPCQWWIDGHCTHEQHPAYKKLMKG